MNTSRTYPKSGGGTYCFRASIAYTEDDIPVQRLHFFKVPPEIRVDALKAYFLSFGNVLELRFGKDPKKKFEPCLSGDVMFANAKDAAKALKCPAPYVDGMEIEVKPSYSWLQPDAYGPSAENQQHDLGPISMLTDYCWVNILQFLGLRDKLRFARSCQRFRAVYQMATAGQYKSVGRPEFSQMTLWDIRDFCKMSGAQVREVICTHFRHDIDEIVDLIAKHCRNLISLELWQKVLTRYTMLEMPTSIEKLKLPRCGEVKDLPIICKHFCNLRELDLRQIKVSGPAWSYIVKNNCCPLLEVLSISLYEDSKCEIVAQLPKLKSLVIDIDNMQAGGDMIDQLVKHKAEQLERLETDGPDYLSITQLYQIAKLTGLRRLYLTSQAKMTGDVLKEFVQLKMLEEIEIESFKVSCSAVLDLFIGCPNLSHVKAGNTSGSASDLVLKVVAQVRREMASKELHRKLPIELVLHILHEELDELILENPNTLTEDIIKIIFLYDKFPNM